MPGEAPQPLSDVDWPSPGANFLVIEELFTRLEHLSSLAQMALETCSWRWLQPGNSRVRSASRKKRATSARRTSFRSLETEVNGKATTDRDILPVIGVITDTDARGAPLAWDPDHLSAKRELRCPSCR